jgi:hypothetical protein
MKLSEHLELYRRQMAKLAAHQKQMMLLNLPQRLLKGLCLVRLSRLSIELRTMNLLRPNQPTFPQQMSLAYP